MRLAIALGVLIACGGEERAEPQSAPPATAPQEQVQPEEPSVGPAVIRVVNDTDTPVTLDRSFGPASPIGVVERGPGMEKPLSLDQEDDAQSGTWVATCECVCSAASCAECEPPQPVQVTLAPGEAYEYAWNGRLRRRRAHRTGAPCWTTILTQPGEYVFSACTEDGRCGRSEVTLPADPIAVRISNVATASCDGLAAEHAWAIRGRAVDQLGFSLRDRPLRECTRVACVGPDQLEAEMDNAREHPCTVFIVPRERELEARVFLPLPEGTHGGESYSHYFDPDLTRLLRARYEQ